MPDTPAARVGRNVRAELARNGLTQVHLAERLHLAQPAVSRRLSGDIPFNVNELDAAARLVRVPIAKFFAANERRAPVEAVA